MDAIVDAIGDSKWSYVIVFLVAAIDAFFPVVPSEATAIAAGVVAGAGDLNVFVLIAAALGAIVGDNICFALGHFLGDRVVNRFFKGEKSQERLAWAQRTLDARGGYLIVVARFIPGGRTVTTFTAGFVETYPWRRFLSSTSSPGSSGDVHGHARLPRRQASGGPWKGLLLGFGIALAVTAAVEAFGTCGLGGLPTPEPEVAHAAVRDERGGDEHEEGQQSVQAVNPAARRILVGREQEDLRRAEDEQDEREARSTSIAAATRRRPSGRRAARSRDEERAEDAVSV